MGAEIQPTTFGQRVRRLRERMKITQGELGRRVGETPFSEAIGQGHVAGIETGAASPSLPVLRALAAALNTNTDYLLGLSDVDAPVDAETLTFTLPPEERGIVREAADWLLALADSDQLIVLQLLKALAARK